MCRWGSVRPAGARLCLLANEERAGGATNYKAQGAVDPAMENCSARCHRAHGHLGPGRPSCAETQTRVAWARSVSVLRYFRSQSRSNL